MDVDLAKKVPHPVAPTRRTGVRLASVEIDNGGVHGLDESRIHGPGKTDTRESLHHRVADTEEPVAAYHGRGLYDQHVDPVVVFVVVR